MSDQDQAAQSDDAEADAPETVSLAREMGWKPETEWKGNPPRGGFTSATEYVRRGEKILPIVNARARKAEEEVSKLRGEMEEQRQDYRKTIARIEKMTTAALHNQKEQIEERFSTRKEAAVETGDKEAYKQAVKEEKEVTKALDDRLKEDEPEKKKDKDDGLPPALKKEVDEWLDENPWFTKVRKLNSYANAIYADLTEEKPGMRERAKLDLVRAEVAKRFPEVFEDAKPDDDEDDEPRRGSRVEGGSRLNGGSRATGYAALPKDVKEVCNRLINDHRSFLKPGETVEKDLAKARERYAAGYFEGDEK